MLPFTFIKHLPGSAIDLNLRELWPDFTGVKSVVAGLRLVEHEAEIGVDRCGGGSVRLEARKLRMMAIANRFAAKGSPRQERFTPQRDQTFGIKVLGVEGPNPHMSAAAGSLL